MKKLFTLSLLMLLTMAASADVRHWDFTNWSSETVANLTAVAQGGMASVWSDNEKGTDEAAATGMKMFWYNQKAPDAGETLAANGVEIAELQGLIYTNNSKARSLCIAVEKEGYHGLSFLWLGSKGINYFVIPNVAAGATIKIGVESHKLTEARGIELYVGRGNSGTKLMAPDGSNNAAPTEYVEQTWQVPSDGAGANEDGTYDITIRNTNGCHMYFIDVVSGLAPVEEAKVAYLYDSTYPDYSADNDEAYQTLKEFLPTMIEGLELEQIDLATYTGEISRETMSAYDAVVVSSTVGPDNAFVPAIKSIIAYEPIVCMSPRLYEAWGYGKAVPTTAMSMLVAAGQAKNSLFTNTEDESSIVAEDGTVKVFDTEGALTGYECEAGSYFANDMVISTIDGANGIHIHNNGRNAYIMLPIDVANGQDYTDNFFTLVQNAALMAIASKKAVEPAATPTFDEDYGNMNTNVKIKCATKGAKIYYTTDGTEPSAESTPYTGVFNVSAQGTVVKAIAYADGYDPSAVGAWAVNFYEAAAEPTITVEQHDGKAYITLETTEPGAFVYWNLTGSKEVAKSIEFGAEPIELDYNATIYAFTGEVTGEGGVTVKKPSMLVSKDIVIEGQPVRTKVLSHMDANSGQWGKPFNGFVSSKNTSKAVYYTEGNKDGYYYYQGVGEAHTYEDVDAGTTTTYYDSYEPIHKITYVNPGNGWQAKSEGQGMLWEANAPDGSIGNPADPKHYSYETPLDMGSTGASSGDISFGNVKKSRIIMNADTTFTTLSDPYSCSMESTEAFQGPFNIVVFTANLSGSNIPKASMWVAADTLAAQWDSVGAVKFAGTQRWIKRTQLSYEGTDKVYVKLQAEFSSVGLMDIYIYGADATDGIAELNNQSNESAVVARTYYNLGGQRQSTTGRGFYIVREQHADGTVTAKKIMK